MQKLLKYIPVLFILMAGQCEEKKSSEQMEDHKHTNALVDETSPYLLQHAHNPVDWMPFGDEAFKKAEAEDKLVLISIGYSACHWCHVMEHETFEDSIAAAYMNDHFVCIKVDREERPDVDQVYMNAVQLMTRSGGWPLNCFTLSDGRPIFGGTYFPNKKWMEVMESLVDLKSRDPQQLYSYAEQLTAGIRSSELVVKIEDDEDFQKEDLVEMVGTWSKFWDYNLGGPKRAPKFPIPNNFEFLLSYGELNKKNTVTDYVKLSLDKMAQGGIYDQVGGGFARYSTDMQWKVPHFEKMLYDNGQLVSLYSQGYQATGKEDYKRVVYQTLDFISRELTGPKGEFYSALDADSEGEEGKFYVWTKEELETLLGKELFEFTSEYYNVSSVGKWEGNYILLRSGSPEDYAKINEVVLEDVLTKIDRVSEILMAERENRVRPGLDDKSLTSWNALMIKGYVDAYKAFSEKNHLEVAIKNAEFIWDVQQKDGSLFHSYKEGRSTINAYLEGYCFVIEAYISLYEVTFDEKWLNRAKVLTDYSIEHFYDENSGMFWFTSDLDPALIARKMETSDSVIPSSNSSIAKSLFLVGTYFADDKYIDMSKQMLKNVLPDMNYGQSFSNWATLLQWFVHPFFEIAVTGNDFTNVAAELNKIYMPNRILLGAEKSTTLPLLEGKFMGETTIFVCINKSCRLPVSSVEEALVQMEEIRKE